MLLIDTAGSTGSVAVADLAPGDRSLGVEAPCLMGEQHIAGRETQERLLVTIADVLRESDVALSALDVIAVVTGPGSFTGVRVGLAAAKGLAESLNLPLVAESRLAVLAAQAQGSSPVQAWIDAGRGDVFVGQCFPEGAGSEAMLRGADAVAQLRDGDAVVVMEEGLLHLDARLRLVPQIGVREALPLAFRAVLDGRFADTALLDANYLRVPDAELARRAAEAAATEARGIAG